MNICLYILNSINYNYKLLLGPKSKLLNTQQLMFNYYFIYKVSIIYKH